jgi:hypothetical protein
MYLPSQTKIEIAIDLRFWGVRLNEPPSEIELLRVKKGLPRVPFAIDAG